jgi:UDPglucose 6-dehydrogenase
LKSYVEKILSMNCNAKIVIKSTVPIGFTDQLIQDHGSKNIFFSPEFLREGSSYQDIISPNRIILGTSIKNVDIVLGILMLPLDKGLDIPCITMSNTEAEAVKLFSNSFLAMRIAFFNELDSFGLKKGLNVKKIIDGISCDNRIGNFYNNPSFGFGGYCLPKDVIQLEKSLQKTPNALISNIHNANKQRLEFIGKKIISLGKKTIGFYRLNAKQGSDNLRQSVSRNLLDLLADHFENIFIFEPLINESFKLPAHSVLVDSIECLAKKSEIIIANRLDKDLEPFKEKVFSRDIFNTN